MSVSGLSVDLASDGVAVDAVPDILVVDDNPDNLRLLITVLTAQNYRVRPVTLGPLAITAAQLEPPELILLDIKMPGMNGYEVCRRLKADARTRHVPIIFLTVLDDVVDIVKGFELGGIDYITKPVRTGELLIRIENQVRLQSLRRQLFQQNQQLQRAFIQQKETADLLKESEEKFSTAFQNSPLPITIASFPDSRFVDVIRACMERSCYCGEELVGRRVQDLNIWVDIVDRTRLYNLLRKQSYVHGFETQQRTKSGEILDVVLFLDFVQIGGQSYLITTGQDITERKRAEKRLQARTQELSETLETLRATHSELVRSAKMAALGNLVAGVAHEINTPVGTAIMTASTLKNASREIAKEMSAGELKRSSFEQYLEVAGECSHLVLSNLQRAGELIQSFKQVAVDQSSLQQRRFLLKPYLQEVITNLTPQIKESAHQITLLGEEDISLLTYPGAIAQVVTILVINSLMHAYPDDRAGRLVLSIEQVADERVILRYGDDGCGIEVALQNRVFDPFYSTARDRGGSGLGLHLVYNLVTQKLGGTIEIMSSTQADADANTGTLFIISLPLTVSSSPQDTANSPTG